jgi:hypothetical protein
MSVDKEELKSTLFSSIESLKKEYANNHYTNYLKDKCVMIVGPDTAMKGGGLGKEIDKADIVIRHNTVWEYLPLTGGLAKDYGSKVSVLYLAPQCIKDYSGKRETVTKLKLLKSKHGLRFIVYQNGNKDGKYITGPHCFDKQLTWWKKMCKLIGIEMHYSHHVTRDIVKQMSRYAGGTPVIPRTGFLSVVDAFVHGVKELKIRGMSFYHGGGHAFRKKAMGVLDPTLNAYGKDSGSHNSHVELEIFGDLREDCNWISVDFIFPGGSDSS